jgi:hypothetical protein
MEHEAAQINDKPDFHLTLSQDKGAFFTEEA